MFQQSRSTLAGVPRSTLQAWLATAQQALADLQTGVKIVNVSYAQGNGSKAVSYTASNLPALTNWILLLNAALGHSTGVRRPMQPIFR